MGRFRHRWFALTALALAGCSKGPSPGTAVVGNAPATAAPFHVNGSKDTVSPREASPNPPRPSPVPEVVRAPASRTNAGPPTPPPPGSGHGQVPRVSGAGDVVSISGRIVSPSGNPLPDKLGIRVHGDFPEGTARRRDPVGVREDGSFTLEDLLNGHAYGIEACGFGTILGGATRVAAGMKDLVITLEPGCTIQGRVLDSEGSPVGAGVQVTALRTQRGWCGTIGKGGRSATRTARDGTFLVEYLAESDFSVSASRGPDSRKEVACARLIPHGSTGVVLRLGPWPQPLAAIPDLLEPAPHEPAATAISGRLLTEEGRDLPEWFTLELVPEGGGKSLIIFPSPRGQFDTGTLAAGDWILRATAASGLVVGERTGVSPGTRRVEFALDPRGTIGGQVFASDGKPVGSGYVVQATAREEKVSRGPGGRSSALTREDGSFLVEYLGDFRFTLSTHPPDQRWGPGRSDIPGPVLRGIPAGARGLALNLVKPAAVRGTLLSADGQPVSGVYVSARQEARETGDSEQTRSRGEFVLRRLAAGPFRASVTINKVEIDLGEFEAPVEGLVLKIPGE